MSPDGLRGWRIDWSEEKGFHVNWWDRTQGAKRVNQYYGSNKIEGGTYDKYKDTFDHFPKN